MPADSHASLDVQPDYRPRRHVRVPISLKVRYHPTFVDQWLAGMSVNISEGGLCISAPGVLPMIGTEISVEVYRQGRPFVKATGIVRWIKADPTHGEPRCFGLELLPTSETTQQRVTELIDAHLNGRLVDYDMLEPVPTNMGSVNWKWAAVAIAALAAIIVGALLLR